MPVIKMLVSLAASTFSYSPGDKVLVNDQVAEEWIRIGHAEAYEEIPVKLPDLTVDSVPEPPDSSAVDAPATIDAFEALTAGAQKSLLKSLNIDGDDSNEQKRIELYGTFLESKGAGGGE